jgi:hypothetical protein
MRPGTRFGLSAIEKSDIWRRWKAGQSLHEIGRAFDKPHSSIRCLLLPRGGIPPAARRRSRLALTLAPRYAEALADLGSRTGDGQTQGLHGSYRCAGLLLRSAKSLAARHKRKHQSAVTAILSSRHRPVRFFASAARPGLAALESTPQKNTGLPNSCE